MLLFLCYLSYLSCGLQVPIRRCSGRPTVTCSQCYFSWDFVRKDQWFLLRPSCYMALRDPRLHSTSLFYGASYKILGAFNGLNALHSRKGWGEVVITAVYRYKSVFLKHVSWFHSSSLTVLTGEAITVTILCISSRSPSLQHPTSSQVLSPFAAGVYF